MMWSLQNNSKGIENNETVWKQRPQNHKQFIDEDDIKES